MAANAEVAELTRKGFAELGEAVAGIGRIHQAVATRAFGAGGPGAAPARAIHDAIARRVYGGLRLGARGTGSVAALAASRLETTPLAETRAGGLTLGILNGLIGDELAREQSLLELPMTVRVEGEPGPRVAIFLHGLMETDRSWALGDRPTYGERLAADLGYTPVYVRYNTGRRIGENGRELAERLEEALDGWPLERVALVGHSMGGLVARCAAHHAEPGGWVRHVRHVVCLGTPHAGAPLAQGVHWLGSALTKLPETRPFGAFLERRSAGIRDLRHGTLDDHEDIPLLEGVTHCFVTATLTRDPRHPVGRLLGDVLVLVPSASGHRIGLREEDGLAIGGASHFALLNHPRVYEQLRAWLDPAEKTAP